MTETERFGKQFLFSLLSVFSSVQGWCGKNVSGLKYDVKHPAAG